jgi:hypothetical protein
LGSQTARLPSREKYAVETTKQWRRSVRAKPDPQQQQHNIPQSLCSSTREQQ